MSTPLTGGPAMAVATLAYLPVGPLVAGPTDLYWPSAGVQSVPKGGGSVTPFVAGPDAASALAIDASSLYWSATGGIFKAALKGGPATNIGSPEVAAIAVDGVNVYYTHNAMSGTVGFVPIGGGPPTVLASGRVDSLVAIAVDDQNVYWVEGEGTIGQGAVAAVPKSGGHVSVLASGLADPMAVAVDGSGIYFANTAGGILGKIPK